MQRAKFLPNTNKINQKNEVGKPGSLELESSIFLLFTLFSSVLQKVFIKASLRAMIILV